MINPINGSLWQWDTGRYIEITPRNGGTVTEVHFFNGTTESAPVVEITASEYGYKAKIPNVFLQSPNNIIAYAAAVDDDGRQTVESTVLTVNKRRKPDDYVFTEDELKTWENHENRIAALEKGGNGGGVTVGAMTLGGTVLTLVTSGGNITVDLAPIFDTRNFVYYEDGESGGGDDDNGVMQSVNVLAIINDVTVTQTDSVLSIGG